MDVEVRHLRKRFGVLAALDDVSLTIPSGGRVALVGPNGSGKSTLTRSIMGMLECEGEIRIGGLSPFHHRIALARRLAYVPQQAPRLGASVGEVVAAVSSLRGLAADAVRERADRLGLDIDAVHARAFRDLSGGMKQKLLVALALAAEASLYILDEPTASLDAATRERFFEMIEALPGAPTLILCSHRTEEIVRMVDRIVTLDEGRIASDGPVDAGVILAAPGRRSA